MKNTKKILTLFIAMLFLLSVIPMTTIADTGVSIYVSVNDGNDLNDGSIGSPFKTIEKAKEKVRELKQTVKSGGITVYLRGGEYSLTESLEFTEKDSGTATCPITYKAYEGEFVNILGGRSLPAELWRIADSEDAYRIPEEAQGKVYQVDLGALGYTKEQIGKMNYIGAYSTEGEPGTDVYEHLQPNTERLPPAVDLFDHEDPQIRARYPNDGWIYVKKVIKNSVQWYFDQSDPTGWTIQYEDPHLDRWANAKHPKIYGLFTYDWGDATVDIKEVDLRARTITSHAATSFGIKPADGIGGRYYGYNMLEELDIPGEYYLDTDTLIMYYYPKTPIEETNITISVLQAHVVVFNKCSYITLADVNVSAGRLNIIEFLESEYCTVDGCTISNAGQYLVEFNESENCTLKNSECFNSGAEGVNMLAITGLAALKDKNNSVVNCKIHDFARHRLMSAPAIMMKGVGHYAGYNELYNGTNTGIFLHQAVDCTIEYNDIHHVIMDTSDAGAIYWGMDQYQQGLVMRYNHIHHNGQGQVHLSGIYADGGAGGVKAYGNIVSELPLGVGFQSFGSCYEVTNNVYLNVERYANNVRYNDDMIGIQESQRQNTYPFGQNKIGLDIRTPVWRQRFPFLVDMLSRPWETFYVPINCVVKNNIAVEGGADYTNDVWKEEAVEYVPTVLASKNQVSYSYDEDMNLTLDQEAIKSLIPDWEEIPIDEIGPSGIVGNMNFERSEDYGGNRIGDTESIKRPTENNQAETEKPDNFQMDERIKNATVLALETPNTFVNGEVKKIDSENDKVVPVIKKGRTLLPVRFIAETFGFEVEWNADLREVTLTKGDKIVKMKIDENILNINGVDTKMDTTATIIEGRTMIPLRALCETALSKQVFWDSRGLIVISDTKDIFNSNSDSEVIEKIITDLKK